MNIEASLNTASPFLRLATIAAETEKAGAYAFAATTWKAAAVLARRECNKQWASERSAHCENALARGWGSAAQKTEE
ncbi:ANR family transcriptional regulator [Erwiniaceae bacterium L1_55_4]|nr:ANR family transcriptional regulator [Erwiniaceae bacterium L1_55_4]